MMNLKKNLTILIFLFTCFCVHGQRILEPYFGFGVGVAVPFGDLGENSSAGLNMELSYLGNLGYDARIGGKVALLSFFVDAVTINGREVEVPELQFIPITLSGAYMFGERKWGAGADVGYAAGISENNDGGLYYQPKLIYENTRLVFSLGYQSIMTSDFTADSAQLTVVLKF